MRPNSVSDHQDRFQAVHEKLQVTQNLRHKITCLYNYNMPLQLMEYLKLAKLGKDM